MTDRADRAKAAINASLDAIIDTLADMKRADLIRRLEEEAARRQELSDWIAEYSQADGKTYDDWGNGDFAALLREAAKALGGE